MDGFRGPREVPMADPRFLPMQAFVGEIQGLVDRGFPRSEVHRLLQTTLIEPASLDAWVKYAPGKYTRHLVFKCPAVELLVICWDQGQLAPVHGHEGELCWARVERGRLRFRNYREKSRSPLVVEPVGEPADGGPGHLDGPAELHSVENPAEFGERAVSFHVYSKPYAECDIYDLEEKAIKRVALRYDSTPESVPQG